jgi:hypothetical protein
MKKIITLFLFYFSFSFFASGQQVVERAIFNSAGNTSVVGDIELVSSVGEPIAGIDLNFYSGFIQPIKLQDPLVIRANDRQEIIISCSPNPVVTSIHIHSSEPLSKIDVFNCLGQFIKSETLNTSQAAVSMDNLMAGLYYFVCYGGDTKVIQTLKIVKADE